MSSQYRDPWTPNTTLVYEVVHMHESFRSEFQQIDVFEAKDWGTVLCLGGVTNVTDRDESAYHEMIAHVPLLSHPNPRRVLIIGGGDGGTLTEVLRHPEVEEAVLVDIDPQVIRCAKTYFPDLARAFDDPRAQVIVGDGVDYVRRSAAQGAVFDVVLIDSTDPVDAAVELFSEAFYRDCAQLLGAQGVLVAQSDSPTFYIDRVRAVHSKLSQVFASVDLYLGQVAAYPSGTWSYCAATQGPSLPSVRVDIDRVAGVEPCLRYLNRDVLRACFALPTYVRVGIQAGLGRGLWAGRPTLAEAPKCMTEPGA
ncbi:MAG TPA: hypothetical protein DCQ06_09940 [Myxococcales bacterium]|nr:spermidine synthase [Myxococcales bacterium]HAN31905.1 hypothetical protein [Myxococcales bacterium]